MASFSSTTLCCAHGEIGGVTYCVCFDGQQKTGSTYKTEVRCWLTAQPPPKLPCKYPPFEHDPQWQPSNLRMAIQANEQWWHFKVPSGIPLAGFIQIFKVNVEVTPPLQATAAKLTELLGQHVSPPHGNSLTAASTSASSSASTVPSCSSSPSSSKRRKLPARTAKSAQARQQTTHRRFYPQAQIHEAKDEESVVKRE